jgi:hypothetical protein
MFLTLNSAERINLSIEQQFISVISWLLVLTLIQVSLYPSLKKTFGDFAFPAAFSASLLIFTIISWYCGLSHLPVQLALLPFWLFSCTISGTMNTQLMD